MEIARIDFPLLKSKAQWEEGALPPSLEPAPGSNWFPIEHHEDTSSGRFVQVASPCAGPRVVELGLAALHGSEEPFNLVHRAAGHFFNMVDTAIYESVHLEIAKLTAVSPKSGPRGSAQQNITLGLLVHHVDQQIKPAVQTAVSKACRLGEFAKEARDKWIAHLSRDLMLDPTHDEVLMGSRATVRAAIDTFGDVLNIVQKFYEDGTTNFTALFVKVSDSVSEPSCL